MNAIALLLALPLLAAPEMESFAAPGFTAEAAGVRYAPGTAQSALPLGGLGTGFIELNSNGSFGDAVQENNWLDPQPIAAGAGFTLRAGETSLRLQDAAPLPESASFWGHFPIADLDMAEPLTGLKATMRAYAPLIPQEYRLSNMPAAFFKYTLTNVSADPLPVEVLLDWTAPQARSGSSADGNVEAALGWRRALLQSGEVWTVQPMILFASSKAEVQAMLNALPQQGEAIEGVAAPEGQAYSHGNIHDFLLDAWGGFGWEEHQRQSAQIDGVAQISQVLWQVAYDDTRAGRNREGRFGLMGDALPAVTEDGALEISLEVRSAGENGVVLAYSIANQSDAPIENVRFGLAANVDLGGESAYQQNQAELAAPMQAIVIEQPGGMAAALCGGADAYYTGVWPRANEALFRDELIAFDAPQKRGEFRSMPEGIAWMGESGSYAIGATGAGWATDARALGKDALQTRAQRTLQPNETAELVFALAWHFPQWTSSDGEALRHRYAEEWTDAGAVLQDGLEQASEIERRVVAWQDRIYAADVPASLKDAVINGLYILPRNSWWLADGRFFQSESFTGCPITETLVCRFNGTFPLALLWPECEQATMAEFVRTQQGDGQIAFSFGAPMGTQTPNWDHQRPIVSTEFVLLAWRNYTLWQDAEWLKEIYPAMRAAMRYAMKLDRDGDYLVNEAPGSDEGFPANQYYDVWPWYGTSAYTGSICLAAWKALEEAAYVVGDYRFAEEAAVTFQHAAAAFDTLLWTGEYYRLYMDPAGKRKSDTSLTNALCGQWYAYACGLDPIVPEERIGSVIDTVLRLNDAATPYGAVNGVRPDGTVDDSYPAHSAALTIGEVWNFCAMAAFAGRKEEAIRLFEESYANIALRQHAPWNIPWSYNPETGAIQWGIHYYSNPCVWTLFQALAPEAYEQLGPQKEPTTETPVVIETDA